MLLSCLVFLFVVNLCHSEDFQDRILGTMVGFLIWSVIVHGFDSRSDKKTTTKLVFSPSWHRAKMGWFGNMKRCPSLPLDCCLSELA